jgi:hypothetical protein
LRTVLRHVTPPVFWHVVHSTFQALDNPRRLCQIETLFEQRERDDSLPKRKGQHRADFENCEVSRYEIGERRFRLIIRRNCLESYARDVVDRSAQSYGFCIIVAINLVVADIEAGLNYERNDALQRVPNPARSESGPMQIKSALRRLGTRHRKTFEFGSSPPAIGTSVPMT